MIEIQIKEEKYEIPTEWKDITLEYWCGLYNIIKKYTETAEDGENKENVEPKVDEVKALRMNKELFKYVTGINDNILNQLDLESVNTAVGTIGQMMEEYKPKGIDRFEFDGDVYFFPKEFLKRNTFGDYIESTQLDATIQMMKHGKFDVLPEQMAILCRKIDEEYDDDIISSKSDKFKKLTMDIVWEFSFFLTMQSVKLTRTFQMFLGKEGEELEKAKAEFLQLDSIPSS
tara:strand:- start:807 stop:1496 length:690 start_codon:yes stop_codon:yes gene_type:complete